MTGKKEITCYTIKEWRAWLSKNHKKEERVFLIRYKKHTGKKSFNQSEAMNEAICFGWIDTTLKRVDDERYGVNFVRRNKNSKWSDNTFARAREMIKLGKMSDFGMEMYKLGLTKKTHDHGIPKNPVLSEVLELKDELEKKKNKKIMEKFEKLAPSYKRMFCRWILHAKLPETRKKRVRQAMGMIKKGIKFGTTGKDV